MPTIDNNINEPHCSFKVCVLLLSAGCYLPVQFFYVNRDQYDVANPVKRIVHKESALSCDVPRFTHAVAIEWLRINFNVFVWYTPYKDHGDDDNDPIRFRMHVSYKGVSITREFPTPQEAIEDGLLYALTNLKLT